MFNHCCDTSYYEKILLIEIPSGLVSLNQICIYATLICKAKSFHPVFISKVSIKKDWENEIARYFTVYDLYIQSPNSPFLNLKTYFFSLIYFFYFNFFNKKKLIRLKIDGFYIGDIVYDQYLAKEEVSTLDVKNLGFLKVLFRIIQELYASKHTLELLNPSAILMSHRVGFHTAPLIEVAEKLDIPTYSYGGMRFGTLIKSTKRHSYEYSATIENMSPILGLKDLDFEECLTQVHQSVLNGLINADAKLAFSKRIFAERQTFSDQFGVDGGKKNIFVMLHAFTDYPHSHFEGMLFEDFHDWFFKTLKYASNDKNVNWIFKMHPSSHYYPVRNIDWNKIIEKYQSNNIVFIKPEDNFNSRSIEHVGDIIITCLGTAGFEFSALARIPSITAGENPYSNSGFAIYPKSKSEYFQLLENIENINRLNENEWKLAKAAYIFIHRLSRVDMKIFPVLSHDESKKFQSEIGYSEIIIKNYQRNKNHIDDQFNRYIKLIENPNFKALRTDPSEWVRGNFDRNS